MSSNPLDEEYGKRRAKTYREYDIICKQFPVLLEKLDGLDPPKKRKRRSRKKKTEADKKADDPPPVLTPENIEPYKELAVIIKSFLKELDAAAAADGEQVAGGSTSQQAAPPAAAGDKQ